MSKRHAPIPVGTVFGKLTVIGDGGPTVHRDERLWLCRCECGNEKAIRRSSLLRGCTNSCGCYRIALSKVRNRKHGLGTSPENKVWSAMRARCQSPSAISYPRYGARGIKVCERWEDFANFYADMGPRPSPRHSIDRIDNEGNYEPENCKWSTRKEQAANRRERSDALWLEYQGKQITLTEAVRISGLPRETLRKRLRYGWTGKRAIETPIRRR